MVTLARLTLRLQERGPSSSLAQGLPVPPRWLSSSLILPRGRPGHCTGLGVRVWGTLLGSSSPAKRPPSAPRPVWALTPCTPCCPVGSCPLS